MANFSDAKIQEIWEKGVIDANNDKDIWRKDVCGAWINRDQYGKDGDYAWDIDHIYPESKGGNHDLENLRPMHWENNLSKSDNYPKYNSVITSDGAKNIRKNATWTIAEDVQKVLKKKFNL
jgi:5-methylcytosine-specific restriction endonuclease McrA